MVDILVTFDISLLIQLGDYQRPLCVISSIYRVGYLFEQKILEESFP